jgi:menaquinol-cytochrome c reductase iron-sulfur subunit
MNEPNPERPAPAPPEVPETVCRRTMLERLCVGLGALCGAMLALPGVGFVLAPLFRKTPDAWRGVGKVDEFKIGETVTVKFLDPSPLPWAGVTARTAAWLRRVSTNEFIAFAVNCSHLGCPVRWMQDANLFMCPCHGGVYYSDGQVAAGPPPRPLTRYPVRITNGEVEIQTKPIPIA